MTSRCMLVARITVVPEHVLCNTAMPMTDKRQTDRQVDRHMQTQADTCRVA